MGGGFDGGMGILGYGGMSPMATYYQNTHTMHYTYVMLKFQQHIAMAFKNGDGNYL
jgi:hypothetical protein